MRAWRAGVEDGRFGRGFRRYSAAPGGEGGDFWGDNLVAFDGCKDASLPGSDRMGSCCLTKKRRQPSSAKAGFARMAESPRPMQHVSRATFAGPTGALTDSRTSPGSAIRSGSEYEL